ncbi:MAG TPA: hypothetical protein VK790_14315 [Solirubrobacteraceae bacterium]|jgi:hypothetical protein|nr:hypothetical protein [Solirubrobacteraceae bacterium]
MSSFTIKRIAVSSALALAGLVLALPLVSLADSSRKTTEGPPLVSTGGVAKVIGTTATLEGSVDPRTLVTSYYFEYGPTGTYGQVTPTVTLNPPAAGSGAVSIKVEQTATGLLVGYHYRLVATNAKGTGQGHDRTYTIKSKKSGFTLPKLFQPTPLGGTFVLSGTLTGTSNANRAIVLQASPYPYTAAYVNVGTPLLTSPTGAFSFRVQDMLSSTKFRIATAGAPLVLSRVVPAEVTVRVVLKARSSGHKGLVRLYGTVTPAEVGAHVFIQMEKTPKPKAEKPGKLEKPEKPGKPGHEKSEKAPAFATKFDTAVKRATRSISRFSVVVSVRDTGHYRAFVQIKPGAVVSGSSSTVLLHAASTKAKRKKNKKA